MDVIIRDSRTLNKNIFVVMTTDQDTCSSLMSHFPDQFLYNLFRCMLDRACVRYNIPLISHVHNITCLSDYNYNRLHMSLAVCTCAITN